MSDQAAVAIMREFADEHHLPFTLVLAVAYLESEWNVNARGDSGLACGLIQVRSDVHGRDCAWWSGYDGARRSLILMTPRWLGAFAQLGDGWTGRSFGEQAAYCQAYQPAAQGSSVPSIARCRVAVQMAMDIEAEEQTVVAKPPITWVGAHASNFASRRIAPDGRVIAPEAWVNHIAEGTFPGLASWFNLPADQHFAADGTFLGASSTHYSIAKDGRIQQHVAVENTAFGNGGIEAGYTARLIDENGGINPNLWTVNCEHEGFTGQAPTAAMFKSSTHLCAYTFVTLFSPGGATGVAIDLDHILRHSSISPQSRGRCPGSGWSDSVWRDYVAEVSRIATGVVTPPVDPRDEQIVQLKAALSITASAVDAEALAAANSATRLRSASQGARDALAKWG